MNGTGMEWSGVEWERTYSHHINGINVNPWRGEGYMFVVVKCYAKKKTYQTLNCFSQIWDVRVWVESSIIGICTKRNQVKILCNNIFSSISTISGSPHPPLSPVIQEIPFWRRYKKIRSLYLWCHPNPQPQPHSHRMVTHILIHIIPLISFDRYLCCSSSFSSFYVPWCGVVIAPPCTHSFRLFAIYLKDLLSNL